MSGTATIDSNRRARAIGAFAITLTFGLAACGASTSTKQTGPAASTASAAPGSAGPTAAGSATTVAAVAGAAPTSAAAPAVTAAPPAAGAKSACTLLDPATIKSAVGLTVAAGRATNGSTDQCLWISDEGGTSPALANMIKAFAPITKALAGESVPLDDPTIAAASKQMVIASVFQREADDPADTSTTQETDPDAPPEGAMVEIQGVGKRAAIMKVPQMQTSGVGIGFVQLADGRVVMVQAMLATAPADEAMTSLIKTVAKRA